MNDTQAAEGLGKLPPKDPNHKPDRAKLQRLAKSIRADMEGEPQDDHIDRGPGFTHSQGGNCPCLLPNAREDTL